MIKHQVASEKKTIKLQEKSNLSLNVNVCFESTKMLKLNFS